MKLAIGEQRGLLCHGMASHAATFAAEDVETALRGPVQSRLLLAVVPTVERFLESHVIVIEALDTLDHDANSVTEFFRAGQRYRNGQKSPSPSVIFSQQQRLEGIRTMRRNQVRHE